MRKLHAVVERSKIFVQMWCVHPFLCIDIPVINDMMEFIDNEKKFNLRKF